MPDPRSSADPPSRPSWRSASKAAAVGSRGAKQSGWAKKVDDGLERSVMRYRTKILFWLSLFVVLVAGFVAWLIWTPMRTPFLVATALNYDFPLPPNAWAREDSERIAALDKQEILKYSAIDFESKDSGLRQLSRLLESAQPGGPAKNVIVIYLSMHGAVNAAGEPCLIPPGVPPLESGKWLRVADLLDALFPEKSRFRSEKINKLLILDSNRMDANFNLGLIDNGFADRLPAVVEEKNIPSLAVLNSTSPGQIGYSAAELQGSVFGYFLSQGLRGAADTEQCGDSDGKVSMQELVRYLKGHVSQWVTENRADHQTPMLIFPPGAESDYPLVFARTHKESSAPEAANLRDPRWEEVQQLWMRHAALAEKQVWRFHPLEWEAFQQGLLRLEQLLQAGSAYRGQFDEVKQGMQSLAGSLSKSEFGGSLAVCSLQLSRAFGQSPSAEELKILPAPWKEPVKPEIEDKIDNKGIENKAETTKDKNAIAGDQVTLEKKVESKIGQGGDSKNRSDGKNQPSPPANHPKSDQNALPPTEPLPAPVRFSYLAASTASWDQASNSPLSPEKLAEILHFVDSGDSRPAVDTVEIEFLRMLENYIDPAVWHSSSSSIDQAVHARNLAETAAAPSEVQAFYWIFPQVDRGDALRRIAEDWLFVGSKAALSGAEKAWNDAVSPKGYYPQAIATTEQLAAAYRLRDHAYGELPYLARWILARDGPPPSIDEQLRAAIENLHRLAASLDAWESEKSPDQIFLTAAKLRDNLENLENAYFKQCADLRTAGEDKQTLAAILSVVAVPLVTGPQRTALWKEFHSIAIKIEASGAGYRVAEREKSAIDEKKSSFSGLRRLHAWETHPILLMLDPMPREQDASSHKQLSAGEMLDQFADQGEHIRRFLLLQREQAEKQLTETIRLIKINASPLPSPGDIRKPLSAADRTIRAAAPLLGRPLWNESRTNPLHRLADLDRHNLLLWQARRMLDDFWGLKTAVGTPYFQAATEIYLNSAAELFKEDIALREGATPKLLETRRQAALRGLQLEKPRDLFVDAQDSNIKQSLTVSAPAEFPPGVAAVYLQGIGGSLFPVASNSALKEPNLRRIADELGENAKSQNLDFWILNDDRLRATPLLQAGAYYRGFLGTREFYVQPSAGVDIVFQKPSYPKPTITVRGEARQSSNLMFIFDCSGSMGAKVDLGPGHEGPHQSSTRIQVARSTLEAILERLIVPHNPYHIGLIIYGHRVGWNPKNQDQIVMRNPKNPSEFIPPSPNFNVHPSDDVELVLPLGEFTKEEYIAVKDRLDALVQMGETPLYLSIIQALGDLEAAETGSARHIIVFTDGGNEQSGGDPRQLKTIADVETAFSQPAHKGVKLDFLGFDIPEQEAEALKALAPKTGGAYYPVSNPASLTKALEKTLGLIKYQVLRIRDRKLITPDPLDLNTTCEDLDRPGDRAVGYRIELADREHPAEADVAVEGGEALELFVKEDPNSADRRLIFRRFDKALRDSVPKIPAPGDAKKRSFFLGAHLPEWTGGGAKFFLSTQNADAQAFSPRPAEIWAEIKPVMPEGTAELPPYIFYDRRFEPDRPVPVVEFFAPLWPPEAKEAEIRLWCKLDKTPPDKQISVADLRGKTIRISPRSLAEGPGGKADLAEDAPEISFDVETKRGATATDPFQIIVTERHPPGGDLALVKVEMAPPPESIKRRYNYKTGVIVHTFFYDDTAASEADRYQILLTTKQKMTDGAIVPPRPLKVTVPRE